MTIDDKALRLPLPLYQPFKLTYPLRYGAYRAMIREILATELNQNSQGERGPLIIFPPSLDWHAQLFQRPQQLALALARQGALVFYIQPYKPSQAKGITKFEPRFYLCDIPVGGFWFIKNPIIYLLTWNAKYRSAFNQPHVLYDYVDDLGAFVGNPSQIKRNHRQLMQHANWVVTTAKRLHEEAQVVREDALLCPNGVDYVFFTQGKQQYQVPPTDLAPALAQGKATIGYYGTLEHWLDFDLLIRVASLRPDLTFVLIGPDNYSLLKKSRALQLKNIYWLGAKPYSQIPEYLYFFDVAMIPFQVNDVTHATSPIKLFEYLAGGKPVVITPMEEAMRYPGVIVADGAEDFSRKLDLALSLQNDRNYLQIIDQVARENTWEARAGQILKAIREDPKSTYADYSKYL